MAEIPIERKEKRNWLPLLLLGLLALLALGYCMTRRGRDDGVVVADSTAVTGPAAGAAAGDTALGGGAAVAGGATAGGAGAAGGATEQFVQFVAQRDTARETEGNHQYTAEGVRRLAAALEQVAGGNPSIQIYADSMRRSVDRLQTGGPNDDAHADDAKAAFSAAVSAMEQIDRARGRTRDVAPMRAIYNQLSASRPLLPQLGTVHRFFAAARDALQAMQG